MILHSRKKPGENKNRSGYNSGTLEPDWESRSYAAPRTASICKDLPWGPSPGALDPLWIVPGRRQPSHRDNEDSLDTLPAILLKIFRKQKKNKGRKGRPAYVLSEHLELRVHGRRPLKAPHHSTLSVREGSGPGSRPQQLPSRAPIPPPIPPQVLGPHAHGGEAQIAITLHWPARASIRQHTFPL